MASNRIAPDHPLRWFIGLLGLVGTVVGAVSLPPFPGRLWLLVGLAVVGLICLVFSIYLKARPRRLLRIETEPSDDQCSVSWELGNTHYATRRKLPYPTRETAFPWLHRYRKGVFLAYENGPGGKLWGYLSMWPVKEEAFRSLCDGTLTESELTEDMILTEPDAPFKHWYVADLLKTTGSPNGNNALFADYFKATLIHHGIRYLRWQNQLADEILLVAEAATTEGQQMLRGFGFMPTSRAAVICSEPNGAAPSSVRPCYGIFTRPPLNRRDVRSLIAEKGRERDRLEREFS